MAKQKKRGWFSSSILHRSSIEKKVEARSRRLEEIRMGFVVRELLANLTIVRYIRMV